MRATFGMMLLGVALGAGCTEEPDRQGAQLFVEHCSACHGKSATGDGPLADDLPSKPADLTRIVRRDDGGFAYDRVMATIYGYPGKYHSSVMPEFGAVLEGEQVMWRDQTGESIATPKALVDLVKYLESIQQV